MDIKNKKIHIIGGTGDMGRWLREWFLSQNIAVSVSGSKGGADLELKGKDIVFISVPISVSSDVIRETSKMVKNDCVLIDMSSVMTINQEALTLSGKYALNIHFLFGPNITSLQNQRIIVNTVKGNDLTDKLLLLLENSGAHIIKMKAEDHDKKMAHIQSLTHFVNLSLAKVCLEGGIDLAGKISTPVFLTQISVLNRVVAQKPELLAEIQLTNPYTTEILDELIKYEQMIVKQIKSKDKQKLINEFKWLHNKLQPKKEIDNPQKNKEELEGEFLGQEITVAYLGPKGTFSHQAAINLSKSANFVPCNSIYDIFNAVGIGRVDFGLVPAENSTEGTVRETLDYLVDFNLTACLSIDLPVHQSLLSSEGSISKITKIVSHPQALAQTRNWLQENLPNVVTEVANSTLWAIKDGVLPEGVGIIGPTLAAKIYSLNLLAESIEDNKENFTKFYLISKFPNNLAKNRRTLLFLTVFNRLGILRDILSVLADFDINLSKIESRPSREKVWDYHFFIEVEIEPTSEKLIEALNILKQYCPVIKVLGSVAS